MPFNYIPSSVFGKFCYLLISSNSEFTPIQIFPDPNSGFFGDWGLWQKNAYIDISFVHNFQQNQPTIFFYYGQVFFGLMAPPWFWGKSLHIFWIFLPFSHFIKKVTHFHHDYHYQIKYDITRDWAWCYAAFCTTSLWNSTTQFILRIKHFMLCYNCCHCCSLNL